MIKAVIFDWGGVLIDNPAFGFIRYCAGQLNVSRRDFFSSFYKKYLKDFQKGRMSEQKFWQEICSNLKIPLPKQNSLWNEAFSAVYSEKQRVFNIASKLHKNGYKTAILSNTEMPTLKLFYGRGYDMFDAEIFSCKEGMRKPQEGIYKIAIERLSVKPNETVFIDNVKEYLEPAKKLGMKTILFKNPIHLEKRLGDELAVSWYD